MHFYIQPEPTQLKNVQMFSLSASRSSRLSVSLCAELHHFCPVLQFVLKRPVGIIFLFEDFFQHVQTISNLKTFSPKEVQYITA